MTTRKLGFSLSPREQPAARRQTPPPAINERKPARTSALTASLPADQPAPSRGRRLRSKAENGIAFPRVFSSMHRSTNSGQGTAKNQPAPAALPQPLVSPPPFATGADWGLPPSPAIDRASAAAQLADAALAPALPADLGRLFAGDEPHNMPEEAPASGVVTPALSDTDVPAWCWRASATTTWLEQPSGSGAGAPVGLGIEMGPAESDEQLALSAGLQALTIEAGGAPRPIAAATGSLPPPIVSPLLRSASVSPGAPAPAHFDSPQLPFEMSPLEQVPEDNN